MGTESELWTYYDFVDDRGNNVIRQWLAGIPPEVAAALDAMLDLMGGKPPGTWARPYIDALSGTRYVREFRFKENRIQWRPLYCYGPGQMAVTLLVGASKKDRAWDPPNAIDLANERSLQINNLRGEGVRHVTIHDSSAQSNR